MEARRLQREVDVAEKERTVLAEIGRLVSSSFDIGDVYDRLIEQVKLLIPLETASIAIADVDSDTVTLEYVSGNILPGFEQGHVMSMSGVTTATQLARFVLVLDTELLEQMRSEFPGIEEILDTGVGSIMATPLVHQDEVVGFLATTTTTENAYGPEHVFAAERIGAQISAALATSRLHARISRISQIRDVLVQIGRDANGARDVQSLYQSVFNNLKKLMPVDRGVVALTGKNGKTLSLEYVEGDNIKGLPVGQVLRLSDLSSTTLSKS